ncbi:MAG TPA: HAD family hydrolase [Vicinamibacterales bacterium]
MAAPIIRSEALLLFDIDGTLILTGGAGIRAMNRAFQEVFGVPDALDGIEVAGRTDSSILADAMARHGVAQEAGATSAFRERYLACLQAEVPRTPPGPGIGVLPGVSALLESLRPVQTAFLGLLTGNYADAAEVKLSHFGLWDYFRCGAFGDDHPDRNHLVPVALDRARACGLPPHVGTSRVVVIGDTPRDVACAHAHGARCLAVATGIHDAAALARAGADLVLDDLSDTPRALDALRALLD